MFEIALPDNPDQPQPEDAPQTDPYNGVALGVECAWPSAEAFQL